MRLTILFLLLATILNAAQYNPIWFMFSGLRDASGNSLSSGLVYTYVAGTNTAKETYLDRNGAATQTNPIVLDARGVNATWGSGLIKFVIKNSAGTTQYTWDYVDTNNATDLTSLHVDGTITAEVAIYSGSGNTGTTYYPQFESLAVATNEHAHYGFLASDILTYNVAPAPLWGSASFSANPIITGSATIDHNFSFQSNPTYTGTGTMTSLSSFYSKPYMTGLGTVENVQGVVTLTPGGTGTIENYYGFYSDGIATRATTDNYAFWSQGTAGSRLGGALRILGNFSAGTDEVPYYRNEMHNGAFALRSSTMSQEVSALGFPDVYGRLEAYTAADGGLSITGITDVGTLSPISIGGTFGSTNPTDSVPAIALYGAKSSGAGGQVALSTVETIMTLSNLGTPFVSVLGSGYIGVGTTTPEVAISIQGATANAAAIQLQNTFGSNKWTLYASYPGIAGSVLGNSGLSFYNNTSAEVKIRISNAGYLGIGVTTDEVTSPLQVKTLPIYANNAAALAGGLTTGAFYRTGADPDPVCVVH